MGDLKRAVCRLVVNVSWGPERGCWYACGRLSHILDSKYLSTEISSSVRRDQRLASFFQTASGKITTALKITEFNLQSFWILLNNCIQR
jgi:hypothetical protein